MPEPNMVNLVAFGRLRLKKMLLFQVIKAIQKDSRRLFHDRLRQLDRKILAGVTKLGWTSPKHTVDTYCTEACR